MKTCTSRRERSRALPASLVAWVALLGLACSPMVDLGIPPILVLTPGIGDEPTHKPLEIEIWCPTLEAGTLQVTLNGVDVSDLFEAIPGTGTWLAMDVWEVGAPVLGSNELIASGTFSTGLHSATASFSTDGDAFADCVDSVSLGTNGGFGSEAQVLGGPRGGGAFFGGTDVLSLGLGGSIVLEFRDNTIIDGPGVDFTVFENAFLPYDEFFETLPPFMEPGRISVSQDGSTWYVFPCALSLGEEVNLHPGCAGVYPVFADELDGSTPHGAIPSDTPIEDLIGVDIFSFPTPAGSGGDSFDLADVGLEWAAFVRVEGAGFISGPSGPTNAGFDLDAVAAVNSEQSGLDPTCP